jgi:DNA topoisomerase-1
VSDAKPGIQRFGSKKNFRYKDTTGAWIRDETVLKRIRSLVIPPAWTDVWISSDPDGHLQAVGRDARGRKQYRYHPRWRETRDSTKYDRMVAFGLCLPRIRKKVARHLSSSELTREKVLATIVRLLEATSIRVGNEEYSRQNNSFGLSTLRDHHVRINGGTICFFFRGKSGVRQEISLHNPRLAKIVRQLRDLPGYELFQFVDEKGERHSIDSTQVNNYIREISGEDFTAKDFRTWNGTVLAVEALFKMSPETTQNKLKENVVKAVSEVAKSLGNTSAVCRKCYIHPAIFEGYMAQTLARELKVTNRIPGLSPHESAVLRFLRRTKKQKPSMMTLLRKSVQKAATAKKM